MSPLPQEGVTAEAVRGDAVVISGMSGLFPGARSVRDLSHILYDKVNPVSSEVPRWTMKHPEAPEYIGKAPELDRFDSQFFMVHRHLAEAMDPMARKVLEHSYNAIYDAGVCPKKLNGKKIGVYIAAAFSDSENLGFFNMVSKTGYGITGTSKTMYANRVSYWLNAKGPSMTIDAACCGSVVALEEAVRAIRSGVIEAAIVGGTNTCLAPHSLVHYNRCIKLSSDGTTKSFDQKAAGCAKSDAISVLFIQKAKNALRAYAEVVHVRNAFTSLVRGETGPVYGFVRDPAVNAEFLRSFYAEADIPPTSVEYIEACGSATSAADKAELETIERVFCAPGRRPEPLLVGSVISNIGLTDAASGVTALTKVLLGYHTGTLASNLHCSTPRRDVPALQEGRMRVLQEHAPFHRTYAAINCLSFTGVNSHVLLRGCTNTKDLNRYTSSIPRLVMLSARQMEHLKDVFEDLKSRPIDAEELALLHNIHSNNIPGHLGRGYLILDTDEAQKTVCLSECMENADKSRRPLWFVYSGMGSQWGGMGAQLMRIPIFAAAIQKCHRVLEPRGLDIVHIITSPDKSIFDNVLNSFVGIAAVQIGLTDVLAALQLRPDKLIGHSVGELGCAYADGCLTAEEMILAAYCRGKASNETSLIHGAMAAVGLGFNELSNICPDSIDVACHNSTCSSTISGPAEDVRRFVSELSARGVFAKEVPAAHIAYHSRYIAHAGPRLLALLREVLPQATPRSSRWVSTSVAHAARFLPSATHCSAEYLTNNLLSPVLFEEASTLIPSDAVLVEVAPHGLLQAILKRALPDSTTNVPLTQRGHHDNATHLLDAIGKLYIIGYNPQVQAIYPKVKFPVCSGTPHLAHLVRWNHSESWNVPSQGDINTKRAAVCRKLISIHDEEYKYLADHVVQGRVVFPASAALVAAWETLCGALGARSRVSARLHHVHLHATPALHDQRQLHLQVALHRGTGRFEVMDGNSQVASGYIVMVKELKQQQVEDTDEKYTIQAEEIYEELDSRGYSLQGEFRSVHSLHVSLDAAQIIWKDNWVTFVDGLLQVNALHVPRGAVPQPSFVRELSFNVTRHAPAAAGARLERALLDRVLRTTRCGGVFIRDLQFRSLPFINRYTFNLSTPTSAAVTTNSPLSRTSVAKKNYALRIGTVCDFDSLHWEEVPMPSTETRIEVKVEYAGINISDVRRATGVIPYDASAKYYGMDFSGRTTSGYRVMGLVLHGACAARVSARPELLWPVPAHWTLADAATVPLAYTQAFYYLCVHGRVRRHHRVLVHGAAGALGQAAVAVTLAHGARVFATVADNTKKRFLLKLFPELNEHEIGNSRDETFADMVLSATGGEGCNIIVSCVPTPLKHTSLKCAAFSGVTIDMVQIQNRDIFEYGMYNMTRQRSYIAADLRSVLEAGSAAELQKLQLLVSDGIARGFVRPLTHIAFAPVDAARAFRLLAASRHRGRVLLRLRDAAVPVTPRLVCDASSVSLVVYEGGALGPQLAERLVACGAKKLLVWCLNSASNLQLKSRLWKARGVDVQVIREAGCARAVLSVARGPLEGVYVCTGSVNPIHELDVATRELAPLLKNFVVISLNNNTGQECCLARHQSGFSATAINIIDEIIGGGWCAAVAGAAERAVCTRRPVSSARLHEREHSLASIILAADENTNVPGTFRGLWPAALVPAVQTYLRDVHQVALDANYIATLTKEKLLEIELNATENKFKQVHGFGIFYQEFNEDELRATADLIPVSTLAWDVHTVAGNIDARAAHLFVVPGLEGQWTRFRTLCARLKLPALVLQPGLDRPHEGPAELANRYAKIMIEDFKLQSNFYILGYEFGIDVALEMAALLEQRGVTGTVYCVGEGPEELRELLERELAAFPSEAALDEALVRHMCLLLARSPPDALDAALHAAASWDERAAAGVHALRTHSPHTAQYVRALLHAARARLATARHAPPPPRALRSRLVLLRARDVPARAPCSLQRYSQQPLLVHELGTRMERAALDLRAPAIVNKYLDREILDEFENSFVCDTYVL